MTYKRRKEIERHLTEGELDEKLAEAVLVTDLFDRLTDRVSFAVAWIEKFLAPHLQKLS